MLNIRSISNEINILLGIFVKSLFYIIDDKHNTTRHIEQVASNKSSLLLKIQK